MARRACRPMKAFGLFRPWTSLAPDTLRMHTHRPDPGLTRMVGAVEHVRLYEHPACQAPAAPLSSSFFLPSPLSLVRPRRRLSLAPTAGCCRRRAQGVSRLGRFSAGHRQGSAFTRPSTTAGLMGSVDCSCPCYLSVIVSARVIPITNVLSAGLATKSMARAMFASTYIRQLRSGLPRCCLHGRSCRRDGAHLCDGRLANADLRCGHTATDPTRPTHRLGCRNSAHQ